MSHPRLHASRNPEQPAIIMAGSGASLSYGELEAQANRGAHLFRALGIQPGDTIAVWLPNCPEYLTIYWAAQRAGLYITPISTTLNAGEASYILKDSGARLLVTSDALSAPRDLLEAALPPDLKHIYRIGGGTSLLPDWARAVHGYPTTPIADETAGFHMIYSSGTTGRPKGIRLPLSGGPATEPHMLAQSAATSYGISPDTIYLSPAPLYHTAPLVFCTSCHRLGATVVILEKFDAEAALSAIERYGVSVTQMVPVMFTRMLRLPEAVRRSHDLSSLRLIIHAAAPCPVDIKREMIRWVGPILYEYYGGSEGNGSTGISSEEWLLKPGSVGKARWGILHVCDDEGRELPARQEGLIYFEGGWNFEYLNDPGKTRDARNPLNPGWSTLGDVGYVDEDGYLFLTDRKSFMIISGGVNIYPQEAENRLISHPRVMDAAVIGVPHPEMGEAVKAIVQPVDWADANDAFADELIAWCRAELSPVKCPRSVDFDRALPRQDNGKLYKRQIRDRYWEGHNTRIH
jgi:long-chain acyl-CoA synthetase